MLTYSLRDKLEGLQCPLGRQDQFPPQRAARMRPSPTAPHVEPPVAPPSRSPEDIENERGLEDQYTRWLGSRGRFMEIAKPLPALVGPVEDICLQVPTEVRGEFASSTPSVHLRDGRRCAIIRGVNYRQGVGGVTLFRKDDATCRTRNWWVEFDDAWRPLSCKTMVDPKPARPGAVQGYEDCRLFWSAGQYWASCNFAERPKLVGGGEMGLLCEMGLLKLTATGDIEDVFAIRGPWSLYHQKNWMPVSTEDEPLRWIYTSDPMVLVTPGMCRDPHHIKWYNGAPWRGGSQAVRLGSRWLWVEHRPVIGFDGPRNLYLHRFVLGDDELTRIEAVSPAFVFRNYGIEFCAGLAIDQGRVVLSYSIRDAFSMLAICSLDAVIQTLTQVA